MTRNGHVEPPDAETSETMALLGFEESGTRVWTHRVLVEAGRFDATAMADGHVLSQAAYWMDAAAAVRGRARLRAEMAEILGSSVEAL